MQKKINLFFIFLTPILWLYPITNNAIRIFPNMGATGKAESIASSSEDGTYGLGSLTGTFDLNFYQRSQLVYMSIDPLTFPQGKNSDYYTGIGAGYRRTLPFDCIIGTYLFYDIAPIYQYSHINWGIEYFNFRSYWRLHTNFYIPMCVDYDDAKIGLPMPEAFDVRTTKLEQHYFLFKNNWGADLRFAVKPYPSEQLPIYIMGEFHTIYDRCGKQLIAGGGLGIEYQNDHYKLFGKFNLDTAKNLALVGGFTIYNIGTPPFKAYRHLCIPRERYLVSRSVKNKNIRPFTPKEERKAWQHIATYSPSPRFTKFRKEQQRWEQSRQEQAQWEQFRKEQQERANQRNEEYWRKSQKKQREKFRQEQENFKRWNEGFYFNENFYKHFFESSGYSQGSSSRQRDNRQYGNTSQPGSSSLSVKEKQAYQFFAQHSGKSSSTLQAMKPNELRKERIKLSTKWHPDKNFEDPERYSEECKQLNNHVDILRSYFLKKYGTDSGW